jgi:hypothetical protein
MAATVEPGDAMGLHDHLGDDLSALTLALQCKLRTKATTGGGSPSIDVSRKLWRS